MQCKDNLEFQKFLAFIILEDMLQQLLSFIMLQAKRTAVTTSIHCAIERQAVLANWNLMLQMQDPSHAFIEAHTCTSFLPHPNNAHLWIPLQKTSSSIYVGIRDDSIYSIFAILFQVLLISLHHQGDCCCHSNHRCLTSRKDARTSLCIDL